MTRQLRAQVRFFQQYDELFDSAVLVQPDDGLSRAACTRRRTLARGSPLALCTAGLERST